MPDLHAQQRADTASESSPQEQGRFLNPPFRPLGSPLVDAKQSEGHYIDCDPVNQDTIDE